MWPMPLVPANFSVSAELCLPSGTSRPRAYAAWLVLIGTVDALLLTRNTEITQHLLQASLGLSRDRQNVTDLRGLQNA
jgi:hypothetical protein